jgi:Tol biopolymer transport system component
VGAGDQNPPEICVGSLDSKERRLLVRASSNAIYAPPSEGAAQGHILFTRERTLLAQAFDAKRLRLTGEPFPVGEQVQYFGAFGFGVFSASENGSIAYQSGGSGGLSQLAWFDRAGKQIEVVGAPAEYVRLRLSHDGRRVALDINDPQTGRLDIWIYDLSRKVLTRLTFELANNIFPVWSPDDGRIVFSSSRKGLLGLYQKASSGTGTDEALFSQETSVKIPSDWSQDGRFLVYHAIDTRSKTGWDLWVFSVEEKKPFLFLSTPATDNMARFSPDGRWLAYQSDESGRTEVYVQSFPARGGKWQISTNGGAQPIWSRSGKELFYVAPDGKLLAVGVTAGASGFEAGTPQALFETRMKSALGWRYDVSTDGRFLINTVLGETRANPITLVQNWAAELKK